MKIFNHKILLFSISIFGATHSPALAEEALLICTDINFNYHWTDEKMKGNWKENSGFFAGNKYFIIDGGAHNYLKLLSKCINKFGKEHYYVLASDMKDHNWYRVAMNDDYIFKAPWDEAKYIHEPFVLIHVPPIF